MSIKKYSHSIEELSSIIAFLNYFFFSIIFGLIGFLFFSFPGIGFALVGILIAFIINTISFGVLSILIEIKNEIKLANSNLINSQKQLMQIEKKIDEIKNNSPKERKLIDISI